MECQETDDSVLIRCGTQMNLDSIQEEMGILKQALSGKKPIIIEASEVRQVDTAGLQLLLSFILASKKHDRNVQWRSSSYSLNHITDLLGLRQLLGLPEKLGQEDAY